MPMNSEIAFAKVQDNILSVLQRQSLVIVVAVFWLLQTLFLAGLPWLSKYFNAMYGDTSPQGWQKEGLCTLPPSEYKCYKGVNLTAAMLQWNRKSLCGCGEGIFGEGICDIRGLGYSVSYYVSAAPAGGIFTALTTVPLIAMYAGHAIARNIFGETCLVRLARLGLLVIDVGFLAIVSFPVCQFPSIHGAASNAFYIGTTVHFSFLALAACCHGGGERFTSAAIVITAVIGNLALYAGEILSVLYAQDPSKYPAYYADAFWLGEVIFFALSFGTAPLICQLRVWGAAVKVLSEDTKDPENRSLLNTESSK